jgi:1-acyl-sn-glycerol-3-phosphate acyltransferase
LAVNASLPVLPIAHNAGKFWPKTGWAKKQGVITVIIGAPMYAEGSGPRAIADLNDRVQAWNEQMQREMGSLPAAPAAPSATDQVTV